MKQPRPRRLITEDLPKHPATMAWNRLADTAHAPAVIQALKPDRSGKCAVFRLSGVPTASRGVIAKRCSISELRYELYVYRTVLPRLPVRTPAMLGDLVDQSSREAWVFIEDLGDANYDHSDPDHRALALQWMGRLHTSSRDLPRPLVAELRATGRSVTRQRARESGARLETALSQDSLDPHERSVVERLLETLTRVADDLQGSDPAAGEDACLVHGDFAHKNLRLVDSTLAVFDWEHAAWGDFSIDLAAFREHDLSPYLAELTVPVDAARARRLAHVGMLQRLVQSVAWELPGLGDRPPTRSVERLSLYEAKLSSGLEAL